VTPLAVQQQLRRLRRSAAVVVVLLALGGAVAAHHAVPVVADGHGMDAATVTEVCLAVLTAVGASVTGLAIGTAGLTRRRAPTPLLPTAADVARRPPQPKARAGPILLCVLRR